MTSGTPQRSRPSRVYKINILLLLLLLLLLLFIHGYYLFTITTDINITLITIRYSFIHGAAIGARPVRRRQRVSLAREIRNLPQRQTGPLSLVKLLLLSSQIIIQVKPIYVQIKCGKLYVNY